MVAVFLNGSAVSKASPIHNRAHNGALSPSRGELLRSATGDPDARDSREMDAIGLFSTWRLQERLPYSIV